MPCQLQRAAVELGFGRTLCGGSSGSSTAAASTPLALRSSAPAAGFSTSGSSHLSSTDAAGSSSTSSSSSGGAETRTSGTPNTPNLVPRNLPGLKRFYKTVNVERAAGPQGGWQLLLDKYPVRTPARRPLVLPTYALALAVAAEWEWLVRARSLLGGGRLHVSTCRRLAIFPWVTCSPLFSPPSPTGPRLTITPPNRTTATNSPPPQPQGKPILHAMPLMSLAATAIDQPKDRSRVAADLLKYVQTDAACVRYEPGPLARRQKRVRTCVLELFGPCRWLRDALDWCTRPSTASTAVWSFAFCWQVAAHQHSNLFSQPPRPTNQPTAPQVFDPLLAWAKEEMGWELEASASIAGPNQPAATIQAVQRYLDGE